MKYRATAVDFLKDGHPVQSFHRYLTCAWAWARITSNAYGCKVEIHEIEERLVQIIYPPEPAEKPSDKPARAA